MNRKKFIYIMIMFIFFGTLLGCSRVWYLSLINIRDPRYPVFCISQYKNCGGDGVSMSIIMVDEVDNFEKTIMKVWCIEHVEDIDIKQFKYGIAPKGYKENMKAIPLEVGKIYTFNYEWYFTMTKKGNRIEPKIMRSDEFRKLKWSRMYKTDMK